MNENTKLIKKVFVSCCLFFFFLLLCVLFHLSFNAPSGGGTTEIL